VLLTAPVLSDALDISHSSARCEQTAGNFSVNLLAEDEWGSFVVVENKSEKSDHDRLGKLLTYLVAFEAKPQRIGTMA
jgi:RecB family endonuclease NucS